MLRSVVQVHPSPLPKSSTCFLLCGGSAVICLGFVRDVIPVVNGKLMKFKRLAILGAEVSGVNLPEAMSHADTIGEIRAALVQHSVLVFRCQELSGDQLLDLGRQFGELFIQPVFKDAFQELLILENDEKRPPVLNTFHQDMTGLREPPAEHLASEERAQRIFVNRFFMTPVGRGPA